MDNINVTCSEIQTPEGYRYQIQQKKQNDIKKTDCKQRWCLENWCLIADPSFPRRLMDPVISVSPDHLVTSRCVNLSHEMRCHASQINRVTTFRARNQTEVTPNPARNQTEVTPKPDDLNGVTPYLQLPDVVKEVTPYLQLSDQWWWISAVIVFLSAILVFFFVLPRKWVLRRFQRETGVAEI